MKTSKHQKNGIKIKDGNSPSLGYLIFLAGDPISLSMAVNSGDQIL